MKNLVTLMMVFCCSIGGLGPVESDVLIVRQGRLRNCLSVEEYFVHDANAGELAGLRPAEFT